MDTSTPESAVLYTTSESIREKICRGGPPVCHKPPGTRHRCSRDWGNAPAAGPFPDQDQGVLDRGAQVEVRQLEPENFSTMRTLLHR